MLIALAQRTAPPPMAIFFGAPGLFIEFERFADVERTTTLPTPTLSVVERLDLDFGMLVAVERFATGANAHSLRTLANIYVLACESNKPNIANEYRIRLLRELRRIQIRALSLDSPFNPGTSLHVLLDFSRRCTSNSVPHFFRALHLAGLCVKSDPDDQCHLERNRPTPIYSLQDRILGDSARSFEVNPGCCRAGICKT